MTSDFVVFSLILGDFRHSDHFPTHMTNDSDSKVADISYGFSGTTQPYT